MDPFIQHLNVLPGSQLSDAKRLALTSTAALIGLVILKSLFTAVYNAFFHPLQSVPGPFWAKITDFYMVPTMIRFNRAQTLRRLHDKYGPIVRIGSNEVSISDWRAYRTIYINKNVRKEESFYRLGTSNGLDNVFNMRNKFQHAGRKKMETEPYSLASITAKESIIALKAKVFCDRIIKTAKQAPIGCSTDVYALCGMFSLDVILQCAFNHDAGDGLGGDALDLLHAMDSAAHKVPIDIAFPFISPLGIGKYLPGWIGDSYRGQEIWRRMTENMLKKFERDDKSRDKTNKFMATPLLTNVDEFLGRMLNDKEVLEESMALIFAGSGTTSTTMFYIIYALARPECIKYQDKLREELQVAKNGLGDELLQLKHLHTLPWLNAIISETMRLYPTIISTLPRILEADLALTFGDHNSTTYIIPKDTIIGMQNYVHHRQEDTFTRADDFLPERWLEQSSEKLKDMNAALTPFSLGRRICLGQNLARAELLLATAEIFSRVQLRLNSKMAPELFEMEDRFNIAPVGRTLVVDVECL